MAGARPVVRSVDLHLGLRSNCHPAKHNALSPQLPPCLSQPSEKHIRRRTTTAFDPAFHMANTGHDAEIWNIVLPYWNAADALARCVGTRGLGIRQLGGINVSLVLEKILTLTS